MRFIIFLSSFAVDNYLSVMSKRIIVAITLVLFLCTGCEWKIKPSIGETETGSSIKVERYDRLQSRYLTTGDFSALQQMSINYPMETRTLIEDILKLGQVNDPEINKRMLNFYQDSTLQTLISDAEAQYANMDDINNDLTTAFKRLKKWIPNLKVPMFYAQISTLDQSIIVSDEAVGISLDKYLGKDYPLYAKYYSEEQRSSMTRNNILPDCLSFYLLSQFPIKGFDSCSQIERDYHFGKIQWVVNKVLEKNFFNGEFVSAVDHYMQDHKTETYSQLLENHDYKRFLR